MDKSILGINYRAEILLKNIRAAASTASAIIKKAVKHSILYDFWTLLKAPTI